MIFTVFILIRYYFYSFINWHLLFCLFFLPPLQIEVSHRLQSHISRLRSGIFNETEPFRTVTLFRHVNVDDRAERRKHLWTTVSKDRDMGHEIGFGTWTWDTDLGHGLKVQIRDANYNNERQSSSIACFSYTVCFSLPVWYQHRSANSLESPHRCDTVGAATLWLASMSPQLQLALDGLPTHSGSALEFCQSARQWIP